MSTETAPNTVNGSAERSVSLVLDAEVMTDLDTGRLTLVASTDPTQGDIAEVSPVGLRAMVDQARAQLAEFERLAAEYEVATTPRTWSFIDSDTGQLRTVTCMPGCNASHRADRDQVGAAVDISCTAYDEANQTGLQVTCGRDEDTSPVLSTVIQVDHFDDDPARRVPHAVVEVIADHYTDPLGPDKLQAVIDLFEQRTAAMRIRHAELLRIRAEVTE